MDQFFADEDALGELLWGLADNLGTIRDIAQYDSATDTTSIVNHLTYDSFGNLSSETNTVTLPLLKFTGRYFDEDIGLQWNWQRWYDASTGRWLSEDPIGFAAGDPNLGRYVGNSPANYIDPSGLDWIDQTRLPAGGVQLDYINEGLFWIDGAPVFIGTLNPATGMVSRGGMQVPLSAVQAEVAGPPAAFRSTSRV